MRYFNIHNHSDFSNNRLYDSINKIPQLLVQSKKKGMAGIGITEHGNLSSQIKIAKFKDAHPDFFNGKDGHGTFHVVLGSEIYLVHRKTIEKARKHNIKTQFYHFIVTAKDNIGNHALRIISTNSWQNSFFFRGMRRLPTYTDFLAKLMADPKYNFKGHVIVSTACLGSELSQSILKDDKTNAKKFIDYLIKVFGKDNVYFEMMPAHRKSQNKVNTTLWNISHGNGYFKDDTGKGIPCIISTDSHYIDKRDRYAHTVLLKSRNQSRDVKDFYYYAHLYTYNELKDYFPKQMLNTACQNSLDLLKRYAPIANKNCDKATAENPKSIKLYHRYVIPKVPIPDFKPIDLTPYTEKYHIDWSKYPWIPRFIHSKYKADRYYIHSDFKGMIKHQLPWNDTYLSKLNTGLDVLNFATQYFGSPMSTYWFAEKHYVIDCAWDAGSLVGIGRGSSGSWLGTYLMGINMVNPIKHHLFWWRFLNKARIKPKGKGEAPGMPDIDIDTESSRRSNIIDLDKKRHGANRVLNFSTFIKLAPKSTILDACRGMKIYYKQAQNIASLLPTKPNGMGNVPIKVALYGDKKHHIKPAKAFISAIKKYKGLAQVLLSLEGTIVSVSEHASGVAIFNNPYTQSNAMMKTSKSIEITQYSAHDSAYTGVLKFDILTLSALDKIHEAMRLLIHDGKMRKQYSLRRNKEGQLRKVYDLRKTYMKYLATDKLDMKSPRMFKLLYSGKMVDAFEFSTLVGKQTLFRLKPNDLSSLTASNSLMRLTVDKGEQPAHRYVRYTKHPKEWDIDMKKAGLSDDERKIMHSELDRYRGICYSQESLMHIAMNKHIAGFSVGQANTLRKSIATKDHHLQEKERKLLFKKGHECGTSDNLLNYVWTYCAKPAENYSFNLAHGTAYSIVLLLEMNIASRWGVIYWNTACLSVNSGIYGGNFKNPNYTKLGRAMANPNIRAVMMTPSVNHSGYGFVPYKGHILYGLYPISGISAKASQVIIKNRLYKSPSDFLKKTQFPTRANIQLIKSGCFDEFKPQNMSNYEYRRNLMKQYVMDVKPLKKRLTMTQIPKVERAIPSKYGKFVRVWKFRSHITGRKKRPLTPKEKEFYQVHYAPHVETASKTGQMSLLKTKSAKKSNQSRSSKINVKAFNKWYNKYTKPLKAWLKTKPALETEASYRRNKLWAKYCMGNPESWEMDSLGCYIGKHELDVTPIKSKYHVADYSKIPKFKTFNKLQIAKPQTIYGTVIGKNANKRLVYLLTPQGIANVRVSRRQYPAFNKRNKKTDVSPVKSLNKEYNGSWFDRGVKLMCRGNRLEDNFFIDWNENPYPLFIILGYGQHVLLKGLKGKNVQTKPSYTKWGKSRIQWNRKKQAEAKEDKKNAKLNKLAVQLSNHQIKKENVLMEDPKLSQQYKTMKSLEANPQNQASQQLANDIHNNIKDIFANIHNASLYRTCSKLNLKFTGEYYEHLERDDKQWYQNTGHYMLPARRYSYIDNWLNKHGFKKQQKNNANVSANANVQKASDKK